MTPPYWIYTTNKSNVHFLAKLKLGYVVIESVGNLFLTTQLVLRIKYPIVKGWQKMVKKSTN